MIGLINNLDPSWISEGDDEADALTVEIWVDGFSIRLICGYGPQENDDKKRKESFWKYLNVEVQKAKDDGAGLVLQMDGNLWAGNNIIIGDVKKKQYQNGRYFERFLHENSHLNVVNALIMCKGKITHVRHTRERTEESILDLLWCVTSYYL